VEERGVLERGIRDEEFHEEGIVILK